ncbi:MAG: T9SS type A sorting domain-containing protein [Bacteroidetes bacterium]|nr:T9SS type A sorting domain-containing protein [Bacteroidota bacterium]
MRAKILLFVMAGCIFPVSLALCQSNSQIKKSGQENAKTLTVVTPVAEKIEPGNNTEAVASENVEKRKKNQTTEKTLTVFQTEKTPHPEAGKVKLEDSPESVELTDMRNENSRTFLNPDGSYSKTQTNGFLHYKDNNGTWLSFDGKLYPNRGNADIYEITKTDLPISIDLRSGKTTMALEKGKQLCFGGNVELVILDENFGEISRTSAKTAKGNKVNGNKVRSENVWNEIDRVAQADFWYVKTDYVLNARPAININGGYFSFEDKIELPDGWQIVSAEEGVETAMGMGMQGDLLIINNVGKEVGRLHAPVYYDNSSNRQNNNEMCFGSKKLTAENSEENSARNNFITGAYRVRKSGNKYIVSVIVPMNWLMANDRSYPVTIDPTASNNYNSGNIASCYYPTFNTVSMNVSIPAGSTVTATNSQCSYTAVSPAWRSDGWIGFGSGSNLDGYYYCNVSSPGTCNITGASNSSIANGTYSTGIVPFTLKVARDYPSGTCNTSYLYVQNSTWTETVTYTPPCTPPGALSLASPVNATYSQPGKNIQFTWDAPVSGTTPFTYTFYLYNGSSWQSWNASSDTDFELQLNEYGSSSYCGTQTQWYVEATNSCGSINSETRNLNVYPKYAGSVADYSISPTTSCQSTGTHSIVQGEAKYYSFSAIAGNKYYFSTCNTGLGCGTNTNWDTYLKIFGTDGSCTIAAYDDDGGACGSGTSLINGWTCTTTGTYYLQVTGYNSSAYGTYYLQYYFCTTPGETALASPANNAGIQPGKSIHFSWNAPTTGNPPFSYTLYFNDGSSWQNWNASSDTDFELQLNEYNSSTWCGTQAQWYVKATSSCGSTNSETRNLNIYPKYAGSVADYSISPATSCQTTGEHSIVQGGANYYSFQAIEGNSYYFSTCGADLDCGNNTGWDTYLKIFGADSDCNTSASNDDGSACYNYESFIDGWTCNATGTYYLQTTGYNSAAYGTYYLQYKMICPTLSAELSGGSSNVCYNTSPDVFTTIASGGDENYTYLWYLNGSPTSVTSPTYNAPVLTSNATIYCAVSSCGQTVNTPTYTITVNPLPVADAGTDTTIFSGHSVELGSIPIAGCTYNWNPIEGLDNANSGTPIASPTTNTTYTVYATSAEGCVASDDVIVIVKPAASECFDAIEVIPDTVYSLHTYEISDTAMWFSFVADSSQYFISSTFSNSPIADISGLYLFAGECLSPILLDSCKSEDSLMIFFQNNIPGQNIYVKVQKSGFVSGFFDFRVMAWTNRGIPDSQCPPSCSNLVRNGDLELAEAITDNTFPFNPGPNHVCGWHTAWGSPQYFTQSANHYASMWVTYVYSQQAGFGEGIFTNISLTSGNSYELNMKYQTRGQAGTIWRVYLTDMNFVASLSTGSSTPVFNSTNSQLIYSGTQSGNWTSIPPTSFIVNPGSNWNKLVIFPVRSNDGHQTWLDIDDIKINSFGIHPAGPDVTICEGQSTTLNATGGGDYSWSPSISLSAPNISNPIATPTVTTTYTVMITSAEGCTATDEVVVFVHTPPTISAGQDVSICQGRSTSINVTGCPSCTNYWWAPLVGLSDVSANPSASPLITTTYTVIATNADGCTASDDITITVYPLPEANAGSDVAICSHGSIQLNAYGGISYEWSPSTGLDAADIPNPLATPSVTTIYTVQVTDINSCKATDDVMVTVNPRPVADLGPDIDWCYDATSSIIISTPFFPHQNYQWSSGQTGTNAITVSPNLTTTYSVTVISQLTGCSSIDEIVVNVFQPPVIDAGSDQTICISESADILVTGCPSCTYWWAPVVGLSDVNIANPSATPVVTTTYSVTATETNGCTASDDITVTVNSQPVADLGPDIDWCYDANSGVVLTTLYGIEYGYSWSTGQSGTNSIVVTPNTTSTYTVTVTNSITACSSSDEIVVNVFQPPVIDAGGDQDICIGESANISVTGCFSCTDYLWSPTAGLSDATVFNPSASPSATTTYTVTVTDINGCTSTDDILITITSPEANAGIDGGFCEGGGYQLEATGGTVYEWSPSAGLSATNIANPLASPTVTTIYSVTVTNDCGTATDEIEVSVDANCICDGVSISDSDWGSGFSLNPAILHSLQQNVTVTGNVTLTNVSIVMAPNVSIRVLQNSSLTLEHCHLYSCTQMWQGIIVDPDGTLIINGGSLIEDAITAVNISYPTVNSWLNISEAVFNKNRTGVSISNYQELSATYPFSIRNSIFTSRSLQFNLSTWPVSSSLNTIINPGTLNEQYDIGGYPSTLLVSGGRAISGVSLANVGAIQIMGPTYYEVVIDGDDGTGTINIFDSLLNGIDAVNSNFSCYNNAFQNIVAESTTSQNGYGISANNYALGAAILRLQVLGNNYFYNCSRGIDVNGYFDVKINGTNMRSSQLAISGLPLELQGDVGVYVKTPYSNVIDISWNELTNIRTGIVFIGDVDAAAPAETAQCIGPVTIEENYIQATLGGMYGLPTDEYVLNGIIADNIITYHPNPTQGLTGSINVRNNHLYQVHNGIHMQGWFSYLFTINLGYFNRAYTSGNYISMRKIQFPDASNQTQYGIMHLLNWRPVISDNNVQGFGNYYDQWHGVHSYYNIPLGVEGHQTVSCNNVSNTGTGIKFTGFQAHTTFENNTMDNSGWGFVIDDASIGTQGNDNYACGNKWTNYNAGQFKTYTMNVSPGSTDPASSILYIDTYDLDQFPQGAYNGSAFGPTYCYSFGSSLLDVTSNSNIPNCEVPSSKSLISRNEDSSRTISSSEISWMELQVSDSVNYAIFEQEQRVSSKHQVYRYLTIQTELLDSSAILLDFFLSAKNGNIGALARAEYALAESRFADASAFLNDVVPANAIESNWKDFYTVYLHLKQGTYSLIDSIRLVNLVTGCLPRDGQAVQQARVLYSLIYSDFTARFDDCAGLPDKKSVASVQTPSGNPVRRNFNLYPNPNNGNMTLDYTLEKTENAKMDIYDISGKKITAYVLNSERRTLLISEPGLGRGIYYFTITVNGEIVEHQKIVILK